MTDSPDRIAELRRRYDALYTGALTDTLYELGFGAQTLPTAIKSVVPGQRVSGPAFTTVCRPYVPSAPEDPERAWEMLGAVPAGHVLIVQTNADDRSALGDLAMAHMKSRGVAGVVLDGGARDIGFNREIGLPTFCAFMTPQDLSHGRGSFATWQEDVRIGEVVVRPGDFVVGDADGVVIVPAEVLDEVLERAEDLARRETGIRAALLAGASVEDAFAANP
jgi:regulator of RNase E activity RraA